MIESCTKRRMIISVVGLGLLTLLILVLEEALTSGPINLAPTPYSANANQSVEKIVVQKSVGSSSFVPEKSKNKSCWLHEEYDVIEECAKCTSFEVNSQSLIVCAETGWKEKISCKNSGSTFRSCSSVKVERRNFLIFTFSMLLLFVLSFGAVKLRTSQLERQTIKNIEKRLAAGQ